MKFLSWNCKESSGAGALKSATRGISCLLCLLMIMCGCKDKRVKTPIGAAFCGDAEFLRHWLHSGGDPNLADKDGQTLLCFATGPKGNAETVRVLLQAGADPSLCKPGNYSPLMHAASEGNIDMVKALVEAGADLNYRSSDGYDAYECARRPYRVEIVGYLEYIKRTREANGPENSLDKSP